MPSRAARAPPSPCPQHRPASRCAARQRNRWQQPAQVAQVGPTPPQAYHALIFLVASLGWLGLPSALPFDSAYDRPLPELFALASVSPLALAPPLPLLLPLPWALVPPLISVAPSPFHLKLIEVHHRLHNRCRRRYVCGI